MKAIVGIICVTAIAIAHMLINGDGAALIGAVSAISTLAGVEAGMLIAKSQEK